MPLLLMDITAATNFLACQAGSNTFATLSSLASPRGSLFKPLPMLPIHDSCTKDQSYAPYPSAPVVEVQNNRTGKTPQDQNISLSIQTAPIPNSHEVLLPPMENKIDMEMPLSPTGSQLTRSSSVYSTDSAHSTNSLETSITQIVEMYTDLISKIPTEDALEGVQTLHPRAYRDTLTPLLQRRFGIEDSPTFVPPERSISGLNIEKKSSEPASIPSLKQTSVSQEFSRNLMNNGTDLVSPLSADSTYYNQMTMDSLMELSPVSVRTHGLSFSNHTRDGPSIFNEYRPVSPFQSEAGNVKPGNPTHAITQDTLDQAELRRLKQRSPKKSQYVQSQDIMEKPISGQRSRRLPQSQVESTRFYQNHPARPNGTEDLIIYNGISDTARAMVKDKMKRSQETRERKEPIGTASQKYPGTSNEIRGRRPLSPETQDSCNKDDTSSTVGIKSTYEIATKNSPIQPQRREKLAAIPLTPYQMYGPEAWKAEKKLKKKRSQPQLRPKSSEGHQRKNKIVSSPKSSETVDSQSSRDKKNGFIAALEGAKMSFTSSSADKRREKLKDSIVVVGTTHLSVDHAPGTGRSLP